jgi:hypothetical protein
MSTMPIIDTPNTHGMFILGTTTMYLCHMPMFTREDHFYQVTLQAHLDPVSMAAFLADKAAHPGQPYNLTNPDSYAFTLPDVADGTVQSYPAIVYRGYVGDGPVEPILPSATVFVDRVIRYRAFNQDVPRPAHLTYVLFGDGKQAHLDHYIARDPDAQHLLTLPEVPTWLSESQLRAGVEVSFHGSGSEPIRCDNPLPKELYEVMFQGRGDTCLPLRVGAGATVWYSTGNMLNAVDPCGGGDSMSMPRR